MTARTAIAWTAHRVRLSVGCGLMTVLACVALSACTSSGSPSLSVFPPTNSNSSGASGSTSGSASGSASGAASGGVSPHATGGTSAGSSGSPSPNSSTSAPAAGNSSPSSQGPTNNATEKPAVSQSTPPAAAPATGGGGTAGFQDFGLAVLGGSAIVAGFGGIAYRRWKTRNR